MRIPFVYFLFFAITFYFGQVKVKGIVLDEINEPIPYASVSFVDTDIDVLTNSDGAFYIESPQNYFELNVTHTQYKTRFFDLQAGYQELNVQLFPEHATDLVDEVTVKGKKTYKKKKENPAYQILKNIWANSKQNKLYASESYAFEQYEKIELAINNIDSTFSDKKVFDQFEFVFQHIDTSRISGKPYLPVFLNESITNVYGKNYPESKRREDLMGNKASGFENQYALIGTIKNLYTDFDIYSNQIILFNKAFVSPLAINGFSFYEYELLDSTEVNQRKHYKIKYYPKRDNDLTFKGVFWVVEGAWAIKEIDLQATKGINVNFVNDVYIEKEFDIINDSVFVPVFDYAMIDMALANKQSTAMGMFAHRTRTYRDYTFNDTHDNAFYDIKIDPYKSDTFEKSDDYWQQARHETLNTEEKNIYTMLDQLNQIPKFNNMVNIVEVLASGYINLGKIEFGSVYSVIGYNDIEGLRLRGGIRTYFGANDRFRANTYLAYGLRDDKFKLGAELKFMLNQQNRWTIGVGAKRDIDQLGSKLITDDGIITRSFGSSSILNTGVNNRLSRVNQSNMFTSVELIKNAALRFDGTYQAITSADSIAFNANYIIDGVEYSKVRDAHLSISFAAEPGKKFTGSGVERYEHTSIGVYPTIILKYSRGLKGIFDSSFDYDKIEALYRQPILLNDVGKLTSTITFSKIRGTVPLSLLTIVPGNQSYGSIPNAFSLVDYYEFITDVNATILLEHDFRGRILGRIPLIKKLKLREFIFMHSVWGRLSQANLNAIADETLRQQIVQYGLKSDEPYYEYGFGIGNIGFGNLRPLRLDFNWRGNYLENPQADTFNVKIGFSFDF